MSSLADTLAMLSQMKEKVALDRESKASASECDETTEFSELSELSAAATGADDASSGDSALRKTQSQENLESSETTVSTRSDASAAADYHVLVSEFVGSSKGELSAAKGETVFILKRTKDGWWRARHSHRAAKGWLPASFLRPANQLEAKAAKKRLKQMSRAKSDKSRKQQPVESESVVDAPTGHDNENDKQPGSSGAARRFSRSLGSLASLASRKDSEQSASSVTNSNESDESFTSLKSTSMSPRTTSHLPAVPKKSASRRVKNWARKRLSLRSESSPLPVPTPADAIPSPLASNRSDSVASPASSPPSSPLHLAKSRQRKSRRSSLMLGTLRRALSTKNSVSAGSSSEREVDISAPVFREHRSHIGVSDEGRLEMDNVPEQWQSLFNSATKVMKKRTSRASPRTASASPRSAASSPRLLSSASSTSSLHAPQSRAPSQPQSASVSPREDLALTLAKVREEKDKLASNVIVLEDESSSSSSTDAELESL